MSDVPLAKVVSGAPGILSPEQLARLLESADEETLPYFAIGAFAGLRNAELERLRWENVDFASGLIEVTAKSSKTASRRHVKIEPCLHRWLAPYMFRHGPVCPTGLVCNKEAVPSSEKASPMAKGIAPTRPLCSAPVRGAGARS